MGGVLFPAAVLALPVAVEQFRVGEPLPAFTDAPIGVTIVRVIRIFQTDDVSFHECRFPIEMGRKCCVVHEEIVFPVEAGKVSLHQYGVGLDAYLAFLAVDAPGGDSKFLKLGTSRRVLGGSVVVRGGKASRCRTLPVFRR